MSHSIELQFFWFVLTAAHTGTNLWRWAFPAVLSCFALSSLCHMRTLGVFSVSVVPTQRRSPGQLPLHFLLSGRLEYLFMRLVCCISGHSLAHLITSFSYGRTATACPSRTTHPVCTQAHTRTTIVTPCLTQLHTNRTLHTCVLRAFLCSSWAADQRVPLPSRGHWYSFFFDFRLFFSVY